MLPREKERIGIIEDTAEIQIDKSDWFRFEARKEQPDLRAVTIRPTCGPEWPASGPGGAR